MEIIIIYIYRYIFLYGNQDYIHIIYSNLFLILIYIDNTKIG